jgi:hypothetical protein
MGNTGRTNVIVVGAGASQEFGFPTGAELTNSISKLLTPVSEDRFQPRLGDPEVNYAARRLAEELSTPNNQLQHVTAAKFIARNMLLAPSIDNFIDTHKADSLIASLGKLAIAQCILKSERSSPIFVDPSNLNNRISFNRTSATWAQVFFKYIVAQRDFAAFLEVISNITFVSFNYDRCIEHFLVLAAQSYFGLDAGSTNEVKETLRIVFPYGSLGPLVLSGNNHPDFGQEAYTETLLEKARGLKTFTEGLRSADDQQRISSALEGAKVIIFLGFSFLDINMQLLRAHGVAAERVLATAKGRSDDTKRILRHELSGLFTGGDESRIELFDGKCFELFYSFDRYLLNNQ